MSDQTLVTRAVRSALFQRHHGDARSARVLYRTAFSLLRFLHHQWVLGGV